MKKIKYYYNTNTLRYEKLEIPLRVKLLRIFGFIAAALVTATLISYFAFQFIGSPNEKILRLQNERLKDRYTSLNEKAKSLVKQMEELEKRDNNVYRAIFEANPIPDSARAKAMEAAKEIATVEGMANNELFFSIDHNFFWLDLKLRLRLLEHSLPAFDGLLGDLDVVRDVVDLRLQ